MTTPLTNRHSRQVARPSPDERVVLSQRDVVVAALQLSADLVERWGGARLPDGKTLAELLTVHGISLWDVVAAEFARLNVAMAVLPGTPLSWFERRIRGHLRRAKYAVLDRLRDRRSPQWRQDWPSSPTILMLGFGGYVYRDCLKPVVIRLAKHGGPGVVSLHDGQYGQTAADRAGDDELRSIWEHYDADARARTRVLRKELRTAVSGLQRSAVLPGLIEDGDRTLWPALKRSFDWLFQTYLPHLLPEVAIAGRILESHRPALIISSDVADRHGRIYTLLGRVKGIPVLELQPAPCGPEGIEWQFCQADRVAATGNLSREAMLEFGVAPELITVTGSPRYDALPAVSDAERIAARAALGVPKSSALALFASSYALKGHEGFSDPALLNTMKRAVFQAAKEIDKICLLVKPHPLEDPRETTALAGGSPNIIVADPRADIRPLIQTADAFVALGTSATADALIAQKLTICPCFPGFAWGEPYVTSGATLVPRSMEEIEQCLRVTVDGSRERVLSDLAPARQRFLDHWVSQAGDACAAARIEALAREMAGRPQGIAV